jgi:hypothetical protein
MKITSNFKIQNIDFADWFNKSFRAKNGFLFQPFISKNGFENLMQKIELFAGKSEITLQEFVAHFCIMYNETGGKFTPLREWGTADYFFNHNPPQKSTYNLAPNNRLAGNQLKAMGVIQSDTDVNAWNGYIFPYNAPQEVKKASERCDYFRFRGWGLNQLTWRANYELHLQPFLPKKIDEYSHEEFEETLNNFDLACKVYHHFLSNSQNANYLLSEIQKGNFVPYGHVVSGWLAYAMNTYQPRCKALLGALLEALNLGKLPENTTAIHGKNLTKSQIQTIQKNIMESEEFGNTDIVRLITSNGGADGIWGQATEYAFVLTGKTIEYFLK